MGQYYITINKTKKEYINTYTFGDGAKFLEFMSSSRGMKEATMMLLTNGGRKDNYLGHWAGDSIEVLGDYAEEVVKGGKKVCLWDEIHKSTSKWKDISVPVYKALFHHNKWFAEDQKDYLKKYGDEYLYTDNKMVLQELFPAEIMEGNIRRVLDKKITEQEETIKNLKAKLKDSE